MTSASDAAPPPSVDPVELDLAFSLQDDLPPDLCAALGAWADPGAGDDAWQALLGGWLAQLLAELPPRLHSGAYSLGLSLVDDAQIAALNGDWRGKAGPTDVLAFAAQDEGLEDAPPMPMPADDDPDAACAEPLELGDIVISLETAARQASDHGHSPERELLFLASHGLLHLLGWDHPDETSLAAMLARQEALIQILPAPGGARPASAA